VKFGNAELISFLKNMMKSIFFIPAACLLVFLFAAHGHAQSLGQYDIKGLAITETSYTEVEGNPYLISDWMNGSVTMTGNKSVPAKLKLDTYKDRLLFLDEKGETLELKNKVLGFTLDIPGGDISDLRPMAFVDFFPATANRTENSWYQLIADGKFKLLKCYRKTIKEDHPYASATVTKTFIPSAIYYTFKDGHLTEIVLSKKSLLKLFDDHPDQAHAYFKTNNVNLKSDTDLQKLFTWYNALN
jgi:hypothetical protein